MKREIKEYPNPRPTRHIPDMRAGYVEVKHPEGYPITIFNKKKIKNPPIDFFMGNRKKRRRLQTEVQEDGSVKLSDNILSIPKMNTYKGSDFVHHFMRKNKSFLNNDNFRITQLMKAEEQRQYRKKKGWK